MTRASIVTISLNQARFVERAIRSVLDQDHDDLEYIVVDPGSTDGSRDIIERYRDRISHVIFEPDRGAADGLNNGFARASGDVWGFLNSDDVLLPGAVSAGVRFLDARLDVDVVSAHASILDEQDREIRKVFSDRFSLRRYAYGACVLVQQSTFFRPELFRSVGGFNTNNRCAWDGELFVDMKMAGARFAVVDDLWSGFRLQPESITASAKLQAAIERFERDTFERIMGRPRRSYDRVIAQLLRLAKHTASPRGLLERALYGPVYGRYSERRVL